MPAVAIPPAALMRAWKRLLGVTLRCNRLLMGARRWPGLRSEMVTWLRALRSVCVRPRSRPPVQGGELRPGKDGPGLWDVELA
jgi:hypothetical protein